MSGVAAMSENNSQPRKNDAPGKSRRHRRQRGKNLIVLGVLVALIVLFYLLTLVRMEPPVG